jgi:hypothetical protein
MVPSGSSFIGKHGDDFMPTNDMAWVGFSVEIGPDGGVYILDWHDQDICGNAIEFPDSGRVYKIMPKGARPSALPNLLSASDLELVEFQTHPNDWFARTARVELQHRAATDRLSRELVLSKLQECFDEAESSAIRLRALWCQHAAQGLSPGRLLELLSHRDAYVRSWAIQLLTDASPGNAFEKYESSAALGVGPDVVEQFERMAVEDPSPVVRLYLASAAQRLPMQYRWGILTGLVRHAEDVDDNNLPRMIWFALEPMVPEYPEKSLRLASSSEIPAIQEFVARRITSGSEAPESFAKVQRDVTWNATVQKFAPGFRVSDVGEGGVVAHSEFRNAPAVQTHPKDRQTPSKLGRWNLYIPKGKQTHLHLRVSHHPHGDWLLRVKANADVLLEQIVGSSTVSEDEWLELKVDLSNFAGESIHLKVENHANDWMNEWAYWNRVEVISQ